MTPHALEDGTVNLARALKEGTQASHAEAERVRFVHEFVKGNISREAYCKLLVSLKHVYQTMEELWDKHWEHPMLEPLYFPEELWRTEAIHADCKFFGIDLDKEVPSKATAAYITQLRSIGDSAPEMLFAHAYVRYLGDLSGGQVLKKAAIRGLNLPGDGSGTRFYEFSRIADSDFKKFKAMYRARMDSLPVNESQRIALVAEANVAFNLNMQIFAELDELGESSQEPTALPACSAGCVCPFAHLAGLAGIEMPAGHPLIKDDISTKKARPQLRLSCSSRPCPLSRFGKHIPKVASVGLPVVMAVSQALLSW